jgi:hypothetical protein
MMRSAALLVLLTAAPAYAVEPEKAAAVIAAAIASEGCVMDLDNSEKIEKTTGLTLDEGFAGFMLLLSNNELIDQGGYSYRLVTRGCE